MEQISKNNGITGSTLKIVAITVMLIDHIAASVLDYYLATFSEKSNAYYLLTLLDGFMRLVGRLGFPIFIFLLVEGFKYTHSRLKYARNLLIFAFISEIPFNLTFCGGKILCPEYQNVFFTLFLGLVCIWLIDIVNRDEKKKIPSVFEYLGPVFAGLLGMQLFSNCVFSGIVIGFFSEEPYYLSGLVLVKFFTQAPIYFLALCTLGGIAALIFCIVFFKKSEKEKRSKYGLSLLVICIFVYIAEIMMTDYSGWGVAAIVAGYIFRNNKVKSIMATVVSLVVNNPIEFSAFITVALVQNYNGKRGINMKYFFYAFYPCHILLLYGVCHLLGLL